MYLIWFIAYIEGSGLCGCYNKTFAFASVASAEYGYASVWRYEFNEILYHGRFARSAHSEVTHRNDGYRKLFDREYSTVEELVSYPHTCTIQPCQWKQWLADVRYVDSSRHYSMVILSIRACMPLMFSMLRRFCMYSASSPNNHAPIVIRVELPNFSIKRSNEVLIVG